MKTFEGKVILITGASGFIGTHLVARLSKIAGVKLLLLSRQARPSTQGNVVWLKGELGQLTPEYWRSQNVSHIDYVFHLGAFTPKVAAEANRMNQCINDNIIGTRALLQSLPKKLEKLIFSSTLDVYAQPEDGEILAEDGKVGPSALYGASKLFCENLILAWAEHTSCKYAILRYGHIYGPGEERYGKLIPVVIRNLLANQAPVIYGDGSALRDYMYVGDAAEATLRAALTEENIDPLNVVRGESVSLKEIVLLLIRLVGTNEEIQFVLDKPNGKSLRFDNSLMIRSLGNWPKTSLADGLAAEVEAFRSIDE